MVILRIWETLKIQEELGNQILFPHASSVGMGIVALLPTYFLGMNEVKAMTAFCSPQSINNMASGILEGPCLKFQRHSFPFFRFLPDLCSTGKADTRHDKLKSSLFPFLASSGPLGCSLPGACLLPTYLTNYKPAYMAFPSLGAPSSSASSPCQLCFSWSAEALAQWTSPFCRAVNSARDPRTGWGPH